VQEDDACELGGQKAGFGFQDTAMVLGGSNVTAKTNQDGVKSRNLYDIPDYVGQHCRNPSTQALAISSPDTKRNLPPAFTLCLTFSQNALIY
jgi:hypothetical protein